MFSIAQSCQLGSPSAGSLRQKWVISNSEEHKYGLFRQGDIYILAQASNLSHSVFNERSVRKNVWFEKQILCVDALGAGGHHDRAP